jgi:hypothetical protein
MTDQPPPPSEPTEENKTEFVYSSELAEFPEIARFLGQYIAAFANFEAVLWLLFGILLGMSERRAMYLLGEIQSFSVRLNAMDRHSQQSELPTDKKAALRQIFNGAKDCNTFRNQVVHGQFLTNKEKSSVVVLEYPSNPTKKQRVRPLTPIILQDEIHRILVVEQLITFNFLRDDRR